MGLLTNYGEDPFRVRSFAETGEDPSPYTPPAPEPAPFPYGTIDPKGQAAPQTDPVTKGGGGPVDLGYLGDKPTFNFGEVPKFIPPEFKAPTFGDAQNEPGYQFRLQAGNDALQHSQAAKGLVRTGGSLKDLEQYNQDFAAQEYGNVYNRALQGYETKYQGAHDAYAPLLSQWQTKAQAEMQAVLAQYQRQWQLYAFQNQYHAPQIPPFQQNPYEVSSL